jgi:transposase InsO family protein
MGNISPMPPSLFTPLMLRKSAQMGCPVGRFAGWVYYPLHISGHRATLAEYFTYYNNERQHSSLDKRIPCEVFTEVQL